MTPWRRTPTLVSAQRGRDARWFYLFIHFSFSLLFPHWEEEGWNLESQTGGKRSPPQSPLLSWLCTGGQNFPLLLSFSGFGLPRPVSPRSPPSPSFQIHLIRPILFWFSRWVGGLVFGRGGGGSLLTHRVGEEGGVPHPPINGGAKGKEKREGDPPPPPPAVLALLSLWFPLPFLPFFLSSFCLSGSWGRRRRRRGGGGGGANWPFIPLSDAERGGWGGQREEGGLTESFFPLLYLFVCWFWSAFFIFFLSCLNFLISLPLEESLPLSFFFSLLPRAGALLYRFVVSFAMLFVLRLEWFRFFFFFCGCVSP